MTYEEKCERMLQISNEVSICRQNFEVWKISSILQEAISILESEQDNTEQLIADKAMMYAFIADAYSATGKICDTLKYYNKALELSKVLVGKYNGDVYNLSEIYYNIVYYRNYYEKDNCDDLIDDMLSVYPKEDVDIIVNSAKREAEQKLVVDITEASSEYYNIADEMEESVASEVSALPGSDEYYHEYCTVKKRILAEQYGIEWKSPIELNSEQFMEERAEI